MRVIQVNKFHYVKGGAERYYIDLSNALRERGHRVEHLSMRHPDNQRPGPSDLFVEEVDYRRGLGPLAKLRQGARSIWNGEAAALARRLARAPEAAVAHLHNIYHQLSPSIVRVFDDEGVPMVQTLHDYKLICPAYLLLTEGKICERCRGHRYWNAIPHKCLLEATGPSVVGAVEAYVHRFLRTYDRIRLFLCPSRFLLEKVASFGVARERLLHLPYFLPLERYRAEPLSRSRRCVYVGRLSREKGIATLIEAMRRLPRGRLSLDVLGDGPLRESLAAKAADLPDDRVRFLGYRSGDALHDTIRAADFAVVPSEWYENLPFAILEPFALGRPVVGARIGGIPELVRDGLTGRTFESGDATSLAEALLWMTSAEADLANMGRNARRLIEEEHAEGPHLARIEQIYAAVRAGSGRELAAGAPA